MSGASIIAARLREAGRARPLLVIAFGVLLYSTGPVLVQASSVSGAVLSFWRLWLGVVVFLLASVLSRRKGAPIFTRQGVYWMLLGGAAFGIHQLFLFTAIKLTTVADVTVIGATSPIITGLLALPLLGERPSVGFRMWAGVAMIGSCVVVLGAAAGSSGNPLGMVLALLNVVFFALFFLVSKRSRADIGVLPFLTGTITTSAVLLTGYVLVVGEPVGRISSRDLFLASVLAAGPGFIGHVVMTWPLQWVPANIPPVMRLAQPVIAGVLAWLLLGEAIGWRHAVGGTIVAVGVVGTLVSRGGRELAARETQRPAARGDGGAPCDAGPRGLPPRGGLGVPGDACQKRTLYGPHP